MLFDQMERLMIIEGNERLNARLSAMKIKREVMRSKFGHILTLIAIKLKDKLNQ